MSTSDRRSSKLLTALEQERLIALLQQLMANYGSLALGVADLREAMRRWGAHLEGPDAERVRRLEKMSNSLLIQHGVRPTASLGAKLDLGYHQVVDHRPATDTHPVDTIIQIDEMGYELLLTGFREKILRPARVVVAVEDSEEQDG